VLGQRNIDGALPVLAECQLQRRLGSISAMRSSLTGLLWLRRRLWFTPRAVRISASCDCGMRIDDLGLGIESADFSLLFSGFLRLTFVQRDP